MFHHLKLQLYYLFYLIYSSPRASFRPSFRELDVVRKAMGKQVKLVFLTATLRESDIKDITRILNLKEETTTLVSKVPYLKNIFFSYRKVDRDGQELTRMLGPLIRRLQRDTIKTPRVVIFCKSYEKLLEVHLFLLAELGKSSPGHGHNYDYLNPMVAIYNGKSPIKYFD